jgi:hypothetical protein
MSRDTRRYFLIIAALALAAVAALAITFRETLAPGSASAGYEFVADVDNWQRTERERAVTTPFNFNLTADLTQIPLQLGEWQGQDVPQTNIEVFILLEPEQYLQRMYRLPDGRFVWLSLIGSRKSKSFHSPQICYDTAGWKTEASSEPVALGRGEIYALRLNATKELEGGSSAQHVVSYFYLWPSYARDSQDGVVLVKVTAPLYSSMEETIELEKRFFQELFSAART